MTATTDFRLEKGKQTRQTILRAAFQLLTEEGPKGLTAGKLATRAKISKANLFHHFKRLDDVPFAVLEELFGQFSTMMSSQKPKSVSEYVYLIGKGLIEAPAERRKVTAAFIISIFAPLTTKHFGHNKKRQLFSLFSHCRKGSKKYSGGRSHLKSERLHCF